MKSCGEYLPGVCPEDQHLCLTPSETDGEAVPPDLLRDTRPRSIVVIPARMSATRFPGKPLADLCGKPMIQWVYERSKRATGISEVIVATCDVEIAEAVCAFGGRAVMTSDAHTSGTDRVAEAVAGLDVDIVVNVQGDEPLVSPESIQRALEPFSDPDVQMASLMFPISWEEAQNANLVKVVTDNRGFAMYFSRFPIPYPRREDACPGWFGHMGLYAYRKSFLMRLSQLEPTPLERTESLEQLRVLENGHSIKMAMVSDKPVGVDTIDDLETVRQIAMDSDL